jgi:hypothetical protein
MMQTVVELGYSNCPWCLDAMVDRLRSRPRVRDVKINTSVCCLDVFRDHDDAAAFLAAIGDVLRGSVDAGEIVMVGLDPHIVSRCAWAYHAFEG